MIRNLNIKFVKLLVSTLIICILSTTIVAVTSNTTFENELKTEAKDGNEMQCVYGKPNAIFSEVFAVSMLEALFIAVMYIGCVIAGFIFHCLFRFTGFLVPLTLGPVFSNLITFQWKAWKFYGPGCAYQRGISGNVFQLSLHICRSIAIKSTLLLFEIKLLYHGWAEDSQVKFKKIRVFIGFIAFLASTTYSLFYSYTYGIPSYFIGRDGNSENDGSCSGPDSWKQQPAIVRYTEISYYVGIAFVLVTMCIQSIYERIKKDKDRKKRFESSRAWKLLSFVELTWEVSVIVISVLVIVDEHNSYHEATAIYGAVFSSIAAVPKLKQFIFPARVNIEDISEETSNIDSNSQPAHLNTRLSQNEC